VRLGEAFGIGRSASRTILLQHSPNYARFQELHLAQDRERDEFAVDFLENLGPQEAINRVPRRAGAIAGLRLSAWMTPIVCRDFIPLLYRDVVAPTLAPCNRRVVNERSAFGRHLVGILATQRTRPRRSACIEERFPYIPWLRTQSRRFAYDLPVRRAHDSVRHQRASATRRGGDCAWPRRRDAFPLNTQSRDRSAVWTLRN